MSGISSSCHLAVRPVSAPRTPLPEGSWDCHAHILGPFDQFHLIDNPSYAPPLAPHGDYIRMLDSVGFSRGVAVHAMVNGWDHSTISHSLQTAWPRLRGVAVLPPDVSSSELKRYDDLGVRGLRIIGHGNFTKRPGTLRLTDIETLAPRLRDLGWHFQIWASQAEILEYYPLLQATGVPVIFDHMASCNLEEGVDAKDFRNFLAMMKDMDFWIKLTLGRVSHDYPKFEGVRPFHDAYIDAFPDRLVFGSDWPYVGDHATIPDVGQMVNVFDDWTSDLSIRKKVFVDNPRQFYEMR